MTGWLASAHISIELWIDELTNKEYIISIWLWKMAHNLTHKYATAESSWTRWIWREIYNVRYDTAQHSTVHCYRISITLVILSFHSCCFILSFVSWFVRRLVCLFVFFPSVSLFVSFILVYLMVCSILFPVYTWIFLLLLCIVGVAVAAAIVSNFPFGVFNIK